MHMHPALLLLTFSPLAAWAFSNTAPLIAWSSHTSNLIDRLPQAADAKNIFENILLNDDVCAHEAVVLVHQPGLHASDLRQLSKSSNIARSLSSASSSRQYAYLPSSDEEEHWQPFVQSISQKCQARLVNIMPGQGGVEFSSKEKSVVVVSMPGLQLAPGTQRKSEMAEHDSLLASTLDSLPSNRVIIYTGSAWKRQEDLSAPERPVLDLASASALLLHPPTQRSPRSRTLLTPGLIMVLLVVLFIFLPVLYFGISALASIQSPIRLDVMPKGYNANERKNQ
ncbi:hypothetical protein BT96DRAFT_979215 [Gymnopus androsaceus JB14]|uniref:Protein BIG1 n=1 Tax=Gymnopus androsaceus JB14 TaxID=1447944 RepID=A0A6A4H508_9AGAR|nr:hypothetical protein BT96DRAFT_979215 [Gymnopus androsaceus JB14]